MAIKYLKPVVNCLDCLGINLAESYMEIISDTSVCDSIIYKQIVMNTFLRSYSTYILNT